MKMMNQCDGCRRGLPVNSAGNHVAPERESGSTLQVLRVWKDGIGCTADRYDHENTCTVVPCICR